MVAAPARPTDAHALLAPRRPASVERVQRLSGAGRALVQVARIYRACFRAAWEAEHDVRRSIPACDAVHEATLRLIALIAEGNLLPLDADWLSVLEAEGHDVRDTVDVAGSPRAAYLMSLPIAMAQGFDATEWAETDGLSAAALLVGVAGDVEGAREYLWAAVEVQAPRLRRRIERVCAHLHEAHAGDGLALDVAGAMRRLPGALAELGLLLAYMWGLTGNTFLDRDPADDTSRFYELPWNLERLRTLAEEWSAARVALARVEAVLEALCDPASLAPVLAAFEETLALRTTRAIPRRRTGAGQCAP